jgi:hypothetical protein
VVQNRSLRSWGTVGRDPLFPAARRRVAASWPRLRPSVREVIAGGFPGARCCGAFRRQRGRTQGRWSSSFECFGIFYVAIVLYWCFHNIFVMLQLIVIVMPSFVVHVLIVVNMLHSRSRHVAGVLCECFKIRSKYFDVANINFRCCGC